LSGSESVAYGGGTDSILQFQLERGGNGTKHCRKIKRRQQACLDSMERKRDTVWRHDNIDWRRGNTEEGKGGDDASWTNTNLTGPKKMKKIQTVDSVATNGR
jgi:hypothetical protein